MKNLTLAALVAVVLAGCAGADVEMPQDPEGSDAMRISPCACEQIPYDAPGFVWRG